MTKRLRVFAGPNGSGKSSLINKLLKTEVKKGKKLDFGIYVNADDIAKRLLESPLNLSNYKITLLEDEFYDIVSKSGLVNADFPLKRFKDCLHISNKSIAINHKVARLNNDQPYERIAQILADYIRKVLLKNNLKFSFETVFSHPSKIEIIKQAKASGYKVYLYFISTEDPEINIYRVKDVRVKQKGHDVEEKRIRSRYYRSMDLMFEASKLCYHVYFFDNSKEGDQQNMFAHFKREANGNELWDNVKNGEEPLWFQTYYRNKEG